MAENRRIILIILLAWLVIASLPAGAASLHQGIQAAMERLESGAVEEAITELRELQVEYPEAPELRFALGYAQAVDAEVQAQSGNAEKQKAAVKEALAFFDGLLHHAEKEIAREASYNRATLLAQEALRLDPAQDYSAALNAVSRAVTTFEDAAEAYPDSSRIFQNLEYMRLKYKELLQQQPEEEEQQEQPQPDEDTPPVLSRFGQATTDLPGARAEVSENTVQLITPTDGEEGS